MSLGVVGLDFQNLPNETDSGEYVLGFPILGGSDVSYQSLGSSLLYSPYHPCMVYLPTFG